MKLKKIQQSSLFLQREAGWFQCPHCLAPLSFQSPTSLVCPSGHRYDLSKKGTLYFLNQQIPTDYNQAMFLARQKMVAAGLYQPLVKKIMNFAAPWTLQRTVDIGCGEGSFLQQLSKVGLPGAFVGMDISKEGVLLATNQELEQAFWCVADLTRLPFQAASTDLILNIFSPSHYREFQRVLRPGGHLLKVVPGADYLTELRRLFYADQKEKQVYSNQKVVEKFREVFPEAIHERLHYSFPVPESLQTALFGMSPLQWGVTEKQRQIAEQQPIPEITIDVEILVGINR